MAEAQGDAPSRSTAAWLGYGGLIPFATLSVACTLGGDYAMLWSRALFGYGAVILSFVGALHWGFAMALPGLSRNARNRMMIWSTVPSLLGWVATLLIPPLAATILVLGFVAHYGSDRLLASRSAYLPAWYLPLRLPLTLVACLCLIVGGAEAAHAEAAQATAAESDSLYRKAPGSPDGIGKYYEGREIAQVMGFDGAPWLDRPSREAEERPDILVRELHLRPGMTVADIGAGSGYLSRRLAPLVAPGKVYAVDVQPQMVELLHTLSRQPGMENIVATQGAEDDVKLPEASVDLAVMVDVYHELAYPFEVIHSLVRALKPGGHLVFVEYRGEDPAVPIKALHKMTEKQVKKEMQRFSLVWERTDERLPVQHIVVFRTP